jgi:hypothetical protein
MSSNRHASSQAAVNEATVVATAAMTKESTTCDALCQCLAKPLGDASSILLYQRCQDQPDLSNCQMEDRRKLSQRQTGKPPY